MLTTDQLQRWKCSKCDYQTCTEVYWKAAWCPFHKLTTKMILVEGEMPVQDRVRSTARKADRNAVERILKEIARG